MGRRPSVRGLLFAPVFFALFTGAVAETLAAAQDIKDVSLAINSRRSSPGAPDRRRLCQAGAATSEGDRSRTEAVTFEGVLLRDVLQPLGLPFGKELRGKALTIYLVIEADDGYRVLFTLPELDSLFTDKVVLLADRGDGKPLSEKEGPLRIVVPEEKRQARWIRQVKSITVRHAPEETKGAKNP